MVSLDFLRRFPVGNATLMVLLPDGTIQQINNLDILVIGDKCPLLALSFEQGNDGVPKASIEASSMDLAIYLLRYLYIGDYVLHDEFGDVTSSLLIHAQLCKIADIFELPELQVTAHGNLLAETELSCSKPRPPYQLCETIRFVYEHLADQQPLIDTIVNYCVACFQYHGLGTNSEFRSVAFDIRAFHTDLIRTNYKRDFQDEGADEIVRLPVCQPTPHSAPVDNRILGDFLFELWCDSDGSQPTFINDPETTAKRRKKMFLEAGFTLVHRPKDMQALETVSGGESSGDEGFMVVHRPKLGAVAADHRLTEDPASSGESESEGYTDTEMPSYEKLKDSFVTIKASSSTQHNGGVTGSEVHEDSWLASESFKTDVQYPEMQNGKTMTADGPIDFVIPPQLEPDTFTNAQGAVYQQFEVGPNQTFGLNLNDKSTSAHGPVLQSSCSDHDDEATTSDSEWSVV